jgi:hypothetical protein
MEKVSDEQYHRREIGGIGTMQKRKLGKSGLKVSALGI